MSRIYWHTEHRDAGLRGSERAWLAHIAEGPAHASWDLGRSDSLERAQEVLSLVAEVPEGKYGANYLHRYLREAETEKAKPWQTYNPEPGRRLISSLETALKVKGFDLTIGEHTVATKNIDLNTALKAGSDVVALAAKIHGWCEAHAYILGQDRKWCADLIDEGLDAGIYRRGLWYHDLPNEEGERKWSDQGWGKVTELLRETDDGPVVLSYSVTDQFPNADIAGWYVPNADGLVLDWDVLTSEEQDARSKRADEWYDLDPAERWRLGTAGLLEKQPWARISSDTLRSTTFGVPVTVYDLFAPDRDERIAKAFAAVA